jgi:rare lipoprotein A
MQFRFPYGFLPFYVQSVFLILLLGSLSACSFTPRTLLDSSSASKGDKKRGIAMHYGTQDQGNRTASGEMYNHNDYTASYRTLNFGDKLLVINPVNGRSVVVRINDRPSPQDPELITLSGAAAQEIGILEIGKAVVEVVPFYGTLSQTTETQQPPLVSPNYSSSIVDTPYPHASFPETKSVSTDNRNDNRQPSYQKPTNQIEQWAAQVGASANRSFAEDHKRRLSPYGWIVEKNHNGQILYHILYGHYNTREEAEQAKRMLLSKGYPQVLIKSTLDL